MRGPTQNCTLSVYDNGDMSLPIKISVEREITVPEDGGMKDLAEIHVTVGTNGTVIVEIEKKDPDTPLVVTFSG